MVLLKFLKFNLIITVLRVIDVLVIIYINYLLIMTTKEFQRRIKYFAILDRAAIWFKISQCESIFKVTLIYLNGSILYDYCDKVNVSSMDSDFCQSVWFDRFSREEFLIQYKYFLAFVNRLSKHQFAVMLAQSKELGLSNLLEYSALNNDCKK